MAVGIKIAKKGKSIHSKDPRDFSLNTDYALFKIVTEVVMLPVVVWGTNYDDSVYINGGGWLLLYERNPAGTTWSFAMVGCDPYNGTWTYQNQGSGTVNISYFLTIDNLQNI